MSSPTTAPIVSTPGSVDAPLCDPAHNTKVASFGLRIASLFIIMFTSLLGSLFPVLTHKTKLLKIPGGIFEFTKYFGSGVIISTAFIHLLSPAIDALSSDCLAGVWTKYPWPLAISMTSVFFIFFLELVAFRWGSSRLAKLGIQGHDSRGHDFSVEGSHATRGPDPPTAEEKSINDHQDPELSLSALADANGFRRGVLDTTIAQIIGIAILEFGIVFHSVIIGLTLAVDPNFKVLFIVLVFHQMFEGLGLGARLAIMALPGQYSYIPVLGAVIYGFTTPLGIAIGLGVRTSYDPESTTPLIISGVLDSVSSGILLYTGLVELLAREFLFNPKMNQVSNRHLVFASLSMLTGAGIMAVLGRWS